MLQKFVADTGRDRDQWLFFLLFAHLEVPQASTGFSLFELLYGCDVQGSLDLLLKTLEAPVTCARWYFSLSVVPVPNPTSRPMLWQIAFPGYCTSPILGRRGIT